MNGSRPKGSGSGQVPRRPARKPVRKPVSPVFRRRRLVVAAALLVVIGVVVGGFIAVASIINGSAVQAPDAAATTAGGQAPDPGGSASTPSRDASPKPSATASEGSGCQQNLISVSAATDKPSYGAGEEPLLTLKVTNNNKVPCEVNIGTSQMEFLITSGSDRIFSSQDCQADSTDLMKTIAPGKSETANFPWQRNRTVQGCDSVGAKPGADGAYYVFTARLADKTSSKAIFQLN